uniref:Cytochrome f n=1 Tax=Bulboplastis apyrenoidosa TaxID=1070855 RepID=A0A1Y9TM61_9RHOD|nr:cytochrome f [Bulboplastis apyrenoidosa]ARO90760.1 cytochrome f [Bulboplastis apyrenoidosa]
MYNLLVLFTFFNFLILPAQSYPIFAQQSYENPREATGRIVCANCHLAQKPVEIEAPQAVLPNTVFEATVKIPYPSSAQQITAAGTKGSLNVGAVVILPEGFKLAPNDLIPESIKEKTKGVYIQPYSAKQDNILVVGPISGNEHQEIIFPILSPDPSTNKNIHFLKYPIYVGGNRGVRCVYPSGEKSNNNIYTASTSGQITKIIESEKNATKIYIQNVKGDEIIESVPYGLNLVVSEGDTVQADQVLNKDPNVGGFGQTETEIVLQSPARIQGMIVFFGATMIAQTFLVLKKKQFEKVQALEIVRFVVKCYI